MFSVGMNSTSIRFKNFTDALAVANLMHKVYEAGELDTKRNLVGRVVKVIEEYST